MYFSRSLTILGGRFVDFAGATFALARNGIILVARVRIMSYLAGVVTALATIPTVMVARGTDVTCGR